ncbi:MAG: FG-GAP-like repeat-containing protein [Patescibacteria group bacterium]
MIGEAFGISYAYENTGTVSSPTWTARAGWNSSDDGSNSSPSFVDLDLDNDYDLFIGQSTGVVIAYENTGTVSSPTWTARTSWNSADVGSSIDPAFADLDNDGDQDLFIGDAGTSGISYGHENSAITLTCNTTYYYRAYATNSVTTSLGSIVSFTTLPCRPTVTTQAASAVTATGATLNGNITVTGGTNSTVRGFAWGTSSSMVGDTATTTENGSFGTGAFTNSSLTLVCNTTYYSRAYSTNTAGTSFGAISSSFTTSACASPPTVTTQAASSITTTTATLNGNITATGGVDATVRGFAYGTTAGLTTGVSTSTENGTFSTGAFTYGVSGGTCNTTYYARAYATNIGGTSFGTIESFTTSPCAPTVTTQSASSVTATGATLNGNITATGGADATVRGFAWGTSSSMAGDTATTTENGTFSTGAFTDSSLTLVCNTTYYSRAYATNSGGTSFGVISSSFTTSACAPTILTNSATLIATTTAVINGEITNTGGSNATKRGFAYGISSSLATVYATTTAHGSFGTGTFAQDATGAYYWTSSGLAAVPWTGGYDYPAPTFSDIDNDGDLDVFLGLFSSTTMMTFENTGNSTVPAWTHRTDWFPNLGVTTRYPAFVDLDNDADYDLLIGDDDGTTYAYENTGTVSSPTWTAKAAWNIAAGGLSNVTPAVADLDDDGDYDVVVGNFNGTIIAYENTGTVSSPTWTAKVAWNYADTGTYSRAGLTDYDLDGDYDLMVGYQSGNPIRGYENIGNELGPVWLANTSWNISSSHDNIAFADLDGDGDDENVRGSNGASTVIISRTYDDTLDCNTTYYFRAYAINPAGTSLGSIDSFLTRPCVATVLTTAESNLSTTTVALNGNISSTGGSNATVRGFEYGTSFLFSTVIATTTDTVGQPFSTGVFSVDITGLTCNTLYYSRAYAINAAGIAYGSSDSFTTSACAPTVTTVAASAITDTTVNLNGNITDFGGSASSVRGFAWGTNSNMAGDTSTTTETGSFSTGAFNGVWIASSTINLSDVGTNSSPEFTDIDNDGDQDVLVGHSTGFHVVFQNTGTISNPIWTINTSWDDTLTDVGTNASPAVADLDNDGDYDILVGHSTGLYAAFKNIGTVSSPLWVPDTGWDDNITDAGNNASPAFADLDNDGDYDLLVGSDTGLYLAFENTGSMSSPVWTAKNEWDDNLTDVGANATPTFADMDYDGDYDLFVGSTGGVSFGFENTGTVSSPIWSANSEWNSLDVGSVSAPSLADLDNDGDIDSIIGTSAGTSLTYLGKINLSTIENLVCNTTYYFRAYSTSPGGTGLGTIESFTTSPCYPTVTTQAASAITETEATLNGNITDLGGAPHSVTRGFAYSINSSLSSGVSTTTSNGTFSTGAFTENISSLVCNTTYYFRPYAINTTGISFGSIESFTTAACAASASISSAQNQVFVSGDVSTLISAITITDSSGGAVTSANDLRIAIATSSVSMLWDTADTTAVLGGTASGKANATVSYEGGGSVLVISIGNDFAAGETLSISGLSFTGFGTANAAVSGLDVYTGGAGDITSDSDDDKTIAIKGRLTLGSHTVGQEDNKFFNSNSITNGELYSFQLIPNGEVVSITNLILRLTGVRGLNAGDFANSQLFVDYGADGSVGASDLEVGTGTVLVNSPYGTVTFATDFSATTTRNYIFRTDVSGINPFDGLNVSLKVNDINSTGVTSLVSVSAIGTFDHASHIRIPQGNSLGEFVAGVGVVSGGGNSGGEVIGDDALLLRPTTTGGAQSSWINPSFAYDGTDGTYATETTAGHSQDYGDFSFLVPNGNIIDGIEVKIEANGSQNTGTIDVALSWNGGEGVTSVKTTATLSTTDTVYTLGGGSDKWGRAWTAGELSNGNFRLRITGQPSGNTISIDDIKVKIHHRTSGGGSGGGGDLGVGDKKNLLASVFNIFEIFSRIFSTR